MTTSSLQAAVWNLLDDDGTYYPAANVLGALNEAQRFFCLLTLCLEMTSSFPLTAGTAFYHMLPVFPDWLLPRRVLNSAGQRLRPGRLNVLDALYPNWTNSPGTPKRYAHLGFDLLAICQQPTENDVMLVTYAQAPAPLENPTDVPEIRENSHFALPNYAAYALRQPEGGQEFRKFLGYFNDFLDEAQAVQMLVKAKNVDAGYERPPFELERMDRSRLVAWGKRP